MKTLKTSCNLVKRSLSVVVQNKPLLIFPVVAVGFICIIGLFFLGPFILKDTGHALTELAHWKALLDQLETMAEQKDVAKGTISFAWFAECYFASMFIGTFFNVAFYNEIIQALNGNRVSLARGIRVARTKARQIFSWSLFAGSVGLIIRTIEDRLHFLGRWILGFIGIAFSVAAIFVVPIIIREEKNANPIKLLKTSAFMLKKCWGEAVIGFIGIGVGLVPVFFGLCILFVTVPFVVGIIVGNFWAILATMVFFGISLLVFACLWSTADQIFRCALYIYASEGVVPGPFDEQMMKTAWKVKKRLGVKENKD
jgi:hypothetical protein